MWVFLVLVIVFLLFGILGADWESRKGMINTAIQPKVIVTLLSDKSRIILQWSAVFSVITLFVLLFIPKSSKPVTLSPADSLAYAEMMAIDTTSHNEPAPPKLNIENDYKLILAKHFPAAQNFHLLLKTAKRDKAYLQSFVDAFRAQECTMNCNISLYDKELSQFTLTAYPLPDAEYLKMGMHQVATSTFDNTSIYFYPYQDWHYKELGGKVSKLKLQN